MRDRRPPRAATVARARPSARSAGTGTAVLTIAARAPTPGDDGAADGAPPDSERSRAVPAAHVGRLGPVRGVVSQRRVPGRAHRQVPQVPTFPRLVRVGAPRSAAVYLDDAAGVRWRVHWVRYGPPLAAPFRHRRLRAGDRRANYLYFVRRDGHVRVHRLEPGSDWAITADVLAAYLARAGVPAPPWEAPPSASGTLGG